MDHFHSTVLQRPPHFDEDGSNGASNEDRAPRGGLLRDILNPVSSAPQAPSAASGPPPRAHSSAFSLRSPTQHDLHHPHPSPYSASPPREPSGPRSILNNPNPFMSAPTSALPPPPLQAPPPSSATISTPTGAAASSSSLQHPPRSPLHAPPVFYPTDPRDRDQTREKASGGYYDPTADAPSKKERERAASEAVAWRNATQTSTPKVSELQSTRKLWAPECQSQTLQNPPNSNHQACQSFLLPFTLPTRRRRTFSIRSHDLTKAKTREAFAPSANFGGCSHF